MVRVVRHLNADELRSALDAAQNPTLARHMHTILLLTEGATVAQTARRVGYAKRWVEELLSRYNERGPEALGDQRRKNGARPRLLTPELLDRLRVRLNQPPQDGGAWTSRRVAALIAAEVGQPSVAPQRGWDALRALDRLAEAEAPPKPDGPDGAAPGLEQAGPDPGKGGKPWRRR